MAARIIARRRSVYREGPRKGEAEIAAGSGPAAASMINGAGRPGAHFQYLFGLSLDLVFQLINADGADHDLVADHVARRTADTERVGKLHVLVDRLLHLVAVHVLLEARHIETDFLGNGERARLIGFTAATEQLLVELAVLLS